MLKAKFICESVTSFVEGEHVKLHAAHGPGNESWSKWTPGGTLEMTISNPDARGKMVPGKAYFLDITEATE